MNYIHFITLLMSVFTFTLSEQHNAFIPLTFSQAIVNFNNINKNQNENLFIFENNPNDVLKTVFSTIAESNLFEIKLPNITHECAAQFVNFTSALKNKELWAITVFDAYGKPTSGILQGSLLWVGEYSECINIKQPWWIGKYCALSKQLNPLASIKYGMCLPSTCNQDDIVSVVNFVIEFLSGNLTNSLQSNLIDSSNVICQETKSLDTPAIIAIFLISIIGFFVLLGTLFDVYKVYLKNNEKNTSSQTINDEYEKLIKVNEDKNESLFEKVILGFSAYSNAKKIFAIGKTEGQLECLHGIRFFSIGWVILGHTYTFLLGASDNPSILGDWLKRFSFQMVSNATYSVDSFFLLSGLLTSYLFLKETSKGNVLNFGFIIKYYVHRYIRLAPPLMIMIMISLTLTKYLGSGPFYPPAGFEPLDCKDTWWTNLLFVNNFVTETKMCLGVSWYLGNDMQFHWISPLILIPLAMNNRLWKIFGISISVLLIVISIIATSLILNSRPGSELALLGQETTFYFDNVYVTPWCRIGPFVVGLLLGFFIFSNKNKMDIKLRRELNLFLWAATLALCGLILFGLYQDYQENPLSRVSHLLYQASSRSLWAIGLSYIIYACLNTQGGIINDFLSWKIWIPLSRLSFSAYLVHLTVLLYFVSTLEHPFHYQNLNLAFVYISIMVSSFFAAFCFSILFEIPLISLEKFIFKRK